MSHMRTEIIGLLTTIGFVLALAFPALSAEFPAKPINLIISFAPGGTSDVSGRALANSAKRFLGQPLIVENKPGGGGTAGLYVMNNKPADGYTLGLMTSTGVIMSYHMGTMNFDPVRDLTHILRFLHTLNGLVVRPDAPWKNIQDFINYSKQNPTKVTIGTAGVGATSYLTMEEFADLVGLQWTHIPYKGGGELYSALLGGHVDAVIDAAGWAPLVDAGKFKLLVTFGETRDLSYPQVPTLREVGYDLVASSAVEVVGPKGMPKPIVKRLQDAFKSAMDEPGFLGVVKQLHAYPFFLNSEDVEIADQKESEQIQKVLKRLGLHKK